MLIVQVAVEEETMGPLPRFSLFAVTIASLLASTFRVPAQMASSELARAEEIRELRRELASINARLTKLENEENVNVAAVAPDESAVALVRASAALSARPVETAPPPVQTLTPSDRSTLDGLNGTTINMVFDGYYEYNFNNPIGRVNLLRAYDVSSNAFSLNQADLVMEHAADPANGKRFGARIDLQFGQATETLQVNPANEPRPEIYRNSFQAYGTYVVPVGSGLTVDFGKWASALGMEGNYTKDQINYSRSYWFDYLPFYHMGLRATFKVNDKLTLNYWLVNGTNQAEATNGYKDELFGFTATPNKKITWNVNYYIGQEHPDRVVVSSSGPIPVQPGLTFQAITPAPNGKLHIFDSYVNWQAAPKLTFALEGDYVIERDWQNTVTALGQSSAPSHVIGGAGYAKYQFSPKFAVAGRAEYLSDRGGLFSGITQALKETTLSFDYKLSDGFLMRYEWRRDFSNQPSFFTDKTGVLSKEQQTLGVGIVWWVGRKEGAW